MSNKYYRTIETTTLYCEGCQQNPLYLSEVSDPASPATTHDKWGQPSSEVVVGCRGSIKQGCPHLSREGLAPRFDEPCCPYCGSTSVYEHSSDIEILDLGAVMERIYALLKSLDWDRDKRKAHLLSSCGKPALALLEEKELLQFLEYLESQT